MVEVPGSNPGRTTGCGTYGHRCRFLKSRAHPSHPFCDEGVDVRALCPGRGRHGGLTERLGGSLQSCSRGFKSRIRFGAAGIHSPQGLERQMAMRLP